MSRQTPIGLIVKQLDNALTAYTNKALARHNVTRFHWQTLNLFKDMEHTTHERLFETMKVFLDKDQMDAIVKDLIQRGWVRREDSNLGLTDEGRKGFSEIANSQDEVRKVVMKGISQNEYAIVTSVLQRMVDNLRI